MRAKKCVVFEKNESCNTDILAPWSDFIFLVG